jgi:Flp pilus assembly protein TadD
LKGEDAFGLPDAEKAITLEPKQAAFLETRAEIYEKLGRRADAIADYRSALAVDTNMKLADDMA